MSAAPHRRRLRSAIASGSDRKTALSCSGAPIRRNMDDVVIAGAGPAGAFAAAILARAGWRVRLFDRARFPRPKLCGDTLNPGAVAILRRHFDLSPLVSMSDAIRGMLLTGPGGVQVRGEYGEGIAGRAVTRQV